MENETTGEGVFRNRNYSSQQGRFTSQDPIRFASGQMNHYQFVGNHPHMGTDPSGLAETGLLDGFQLPASYPNFATSNFTDQEMVAYRESLSATIAKLKLIQREVQARRRHYSHALGSRGSHRLSVEKRAELTEQLNVYRALDTKYSNAVAAALATEWDLVNTVNSRRARAWRTSVGARVSARHGMPASLRMKQSELDTNVDYYQQQIAIEILTAGLGKLAHLRHLSRAKLASGVVDDVARHVDELEELGRIVPNRGLLILNPSFTPIGVADDVAFGLWRHQGTRAGGLLDGFAGHVGAKTYGDLYGAGVFPTERMLERMMYGSRRLHVNLDGLVKSVDELPGIVQKGSKGMLHQPSPGVGNVTNWEIWRIHQDPELLSKTIFYLNGKKVMP